MTPIEVEPNRSRGPGAAEPRHIGVAVASFNQTITDRLLDGAIQTLECDRGVGGIRFLGWPVPGSYPSLLPMLVERAARGGGDRCGDQRRDRSLRSHRSGVGRGIDQWRPSTQGVPVTNAVLAAHDYEQALDRSEPGPGNKGAEAAAAVGRRGPARPVRDGCRVRPRLTLDSHNEYQAEAGCFPPGHLRCARVHGGKRRPDGANLVAGRSSDLVAAGTSCCFFVGDNETKTEVGTSPNYE